jgi:hypothetical protein
MILRQGRRRQRGRNSQHAKAEQRRSATPYGRTNVPFDHGQRNPCAQGEHPLLG